MKDEQGDINFIELQPIHSILLYINCIVSFLTMRHYHITCICIASSLASHLNCCMSNLL